MCAALHSQHENYGFDAHWPVHLHQTTENVFRLTRDRDENRHNAILY